MDRWEHCFIIGEHVEDLRDKYGGYNRRVAYFMGEDGANTVRRVVLVEKSPAYPDLLARFDGPFIAQLGDEGWELVHASEHHSWPWLYFKRRAPG